MNFCSDFKRIKRLVLSSIETFFLNLDNMVVLTEAASGHYMWTPLIAAMARAKKVIAVTRDSQYGAADDIIKNAKAHADELGISHLIEFSKEPAISYAQDANIVTNLGFVRPIKKDFIEFLPPDSAISLMWETWEYRPEDLDLQACKARNIPVIGTNERHNDLQIFRYVGLIALKLLLQADVEVFKSRIVILGSGHFGEATNNVLCVNGATTLHLSNYYADKLNQQAFKDFISTADAIVVAEHSKTNELIGKAGIIPSDLIKNSGIKIAFICGNIDFESIMANNIDIFPPKMVDFGHMAITTDFVGPRPLIDLHTAGLKVGQELITGMRLYKDSKKAIQHALAHSPAMDFPQELSS